ncbi:MAG: DUF4363 family protein [Oscillospiraceae bacterium]|nr:DUF4363 family protein [Oscillospiraceae bacterium]
MKQMIVVLFLAVGVIAVCLYARSQATQARDQLHIYAEAIFSGAEQEDEDAVKKAVEAITSYWEVEQHRLIPFFRHAEVDEVSRAVARLGAYTDPEDRSDLESELRAILWQINHIWESDRFRIGNFLLQLPKSSSAILCREWLQVR